MDGQVSVLVERDEGVQAVITAVKFDEYHNFIAEAGRSTQFGKHRIVSHGIDSKAIIDKRADGCRYTRRTKEISSFHNQELVG